jgi:hypothetical protein
MLRHNPPGSPPVVDRKTGARTGERGDHVPVSIIERKRSHGARCRGLFDDVDAARAKAVAGDVHRDLARHQAGEIVLDGHLALPLESPATPGR